MVDVGAAHERQCPWGADKCTGCPGPGVTGDFEPFEIVSSSLEWRSVFLTAETSLQPRVLFLR